LQKKFYKNKKNEKTFRDRGSMFNYRIMWENYSKTIAWKDKIKKIYLLVLFNYKY